MKNTKIILIALIAIMGFTGCASLQQKFKRKKQPIKGAPKFYNEQEYRVTPNMELYQKHYIFWKSWHNEIMRELGDNSKKDMRCVEEIIGNLEDMWTMLDDAKGDQLDKCINQMKKIQNELAKKNLTQATKTRTARILQKEFNIIKVNFSYRKIGPYLRPEFRRRDVAPIT